MGRPKAKHEPRRERAAPAVPAPRSNSAARPSATTWLLAAVVLVATWVVFHLSLDGQWLRWDDDQLLLDRDEWRGFEPRRLAWMFTTFHMGPYQPLSWLSYAFDHARAGLDARAYHATNVALHAASGVLLFFLARRIFVLARERSAADSADAAAARREVRADTPWTARTLDLAAAATALAWSLHPLRVESVAWITERRDCLSAVFFLLACHAWLAWAGSERPRRLHYVLAVVAFAASLLAKGSALAFPLVILALDAWPLRRLGPGPGLLARWRPRLVDAAPFVALSLAAAVLAVVGQSATSAIVRAETHGIGARLVVAAHGLVHYVRATAWPTDLMVLHPMRTPFDPGETRFVVAVALVVAGGIAVVVARRRVPAVLVAVVAYAALVAPVLGLVQIGSQLVADRYAYVPTIPLVLLGGGAVLALAERCRAAPARALLVVVLGVGVAAPLAAATRRQIPVWRDTVSLWEHDLAIDPTSTPARRALLAELQVLGRAEADPVRRRAVFERGLEVFRAGDALAPDAGSRVQAAKLCDLLAADWPDERERFLATGLEHARAAVERARATGQRLPEAHESAAVLLAELGRPAEAVTHLEALVELEPRRASARAMLGEVLLQSGRFADALPPLLAAREIDPSSITIQLDLGDAYRLLGRVDDAVAAYRGVLAARRAALGPACVSDPEYAAAAGALGAMGRGP